MKRKYEQGERERGKMGKMAIDDVRQNERGPFPPTVPFTQTGSLYMGRVPAAAQASMSMAQQIQLQTLAMDRVSAATARNVNAIEMAEQMQQLAYQQTLAMNPMDRVSANGQASTSMNEMAQQPQQQTLAMNPNTPSIELTTPSLYAQPPPPHTPVVQHELKQPEDPKSEEIFGRMGALDVNERLTEMVFQRIKDEEQDWFVSMTEPRTGLNEDGQLQESEETMLEEGAILERTTEMYGSR